MFRRCFIVVSCFVTCLAAAAQAGQVRVTVGNGSQNFAPRAVNANVGDQIVWVWATGGHSCTSGDSSTVTPDGHWDSGLLAGSGLGFGWKVPAGLTTYRYYCTPHAPAMAGRVIVNGSSIAVSDFRITEVQFNEAAGHDLIEITNLGDAAGDLARYRLAVANGASVALPLLNFVPVAPGGTITVHTNQAGTNTATDLFAPTLGNLGDASGAIALYVPGPTLTFGLTNVDQLVDYVAWGASNGPNETVADGAGFWNAGEFVPAVAAGHSIEFCGTTGQHGAARWYDNGTPNFSGAAENCATPVRTSSWGRIKTLYR
jgi:plastocyanin